VTTQGLEQVRYGAMLDELFDLGAPEPGPAGSEDDELAALVVEADPAVAPLLFAVAGAPMPEAGFELEADGRIVATAELAWEKRRVAVLLAREAEGRPRFEAAGWRVFVADDLAGTVEPLLAALEIGATR